MTSSAACNSASRPAACCITARASGIPGEQLPRWAFALYWRADGAAAVGRPSPHRAAKPPDDNARPSTDADRFTEQRCATQLGLPADSGIPAYEDAAHFMLVEQKLPVNVTPEDNKLEDPAERARLVRVFDRGVAASRRATCCRSRSGTRRIAAAAG